MPNAQLCVTVTGSTMAELRERRDQVVDADLVELRLDTVADPSAAGALEGARLPVIVTCRAEMGRRAVSPGSEEERWRILSRRAEARRGLHRRRVEVRTSSSSSSGGADAASSSRITTSRACRRTSTAQRPGHARDRRRGGQGRGDGAAAGRQPAAACSVAQVGDRSRSSRWRWARPGWRRASSRRGSARRGPMPVTASRPARFPPARMRGEFSFSQLSDTDRALRRRRPARSCIRCRRRCTTPRSGASASMPCICRWPRPTSTTS